MVLLLFCSISANASKIDIKTLQNAANAFHSENQKDWSFTLEEVKKEKLSEIIYHPIIEGVGKVELKSLDGRNPTEDEIEKFKKHHRNRKSKSVDKKDNTFEIVSWDTVEMISEDEETASFGFTPFMDFGGEPKLIPELKGILVYDRKGEFISSLSMNAPKPFKPDGKVKFKKMNVDMTFQKMEDGSILIRSIRNQVKGRAMLLIGFDQNESLRYFNYRK